MRFLTLLGQFVPANSPDSEQTVTVTSVTSGFVTGCRVESFASGRARPCVLQYDFG